MPTALIHCILVTVDSADRIIRDGTIVFEKGVIAAVGPTDSIQLPPDTHCIDGQGKWAVLPGLVDAHSHSSLLKGYSENLNLMQWLPVYQREHQVLTEEDAYWAAMISYLEALKGGTTTVLDMYRFMHRCAEAAKNLGIRAHIAPYVADSDDKTFFESLDSNEAFIQSHHESDEGRLKALVGLEHLFYCSPEAYRRARHMAEHYDVQIHTHTSELQSEVQAVEQHFGKRPIHLLHDYGILTPRTHLAHCVWLDDSETQRLVDCGLAGLSLCPTSNAKLAGGVPPYTRYKERGLTMGLGTDGAISNNSLSMWELMKTASLQQKNLLFDAAALPAPEVLRLATMGGAKLLGQDKLIGSLEPGKRADLITVNLWQPHLMPIADDGEHDPVIWNLVYAARASDVQHVWVDGRQVLKDGRSTRIDEDEVLLHVHRQTQELLQRRKATQTIQMNGKGTAADAT